MDNIDEIIDDMKEVEDYELKDNDEIFERSLNVIKKAMKDVKQEIIIQLPDGTSHVVYIMALALNNGNVEYSFSTLSEDRKEELSHHVDNCLKAQIDTILQELNSKRKPIGW